MSFFCCVCLLEPNWVTQTNLGAKHSNKLGEGESIQLRIYRHIYTHICMYVDARICSNTNTYIYIYICIHIYIC